MISANAKWDKDHKIDEIISEYVKCIMDVNPIIARQCIKDLPNVAKHKTELKNDITNPLYMVDISIYADSMQSLVYKDIRKVKINAEVGDSNCIFEV